jgi:hypothetical protein
MDPQTLAMMSLLFGGGAGLPEGSGVNSLQDVLFNTILSPNWGMLTGSYDPYLTLPEQQYVPDPSVGMPIAFSAAQGEGTMARIASGLMSGDMPYDDALRFLAKNQADPAADVYGMDLAGEVSKIRDEVNSYNAQVAEAQFGAANQGDNVYAKAGLPTPDRQYSFEDMPKSSRLQALMGVIGKGDEDLAKQAALYEGPAPTVKMRSAGRRGSPSIRGGAKDEDEVTRSGLLESRTGGEQRPIEPTTAGRARMMDDMYGDRPVQPTTAGRVQAMGSMYGSTAPRGNVSGREPNAAVMMEFIDPEWLKGRQKYRTNKRQGELRSKRANAMAMGEQMALQDTGRTPFNDAMQERFAQLAMLRQIGLL